MPFRANEHPTLSNLPNVSSLLKTQNEPVIAKELKTVTYHFLLPSYHTDTVYDVI